jgi:peptidoglycan-associated lipoprotein
MKRCIPIVAALLALPALGGCATEEPKSPDRGLTEPFKPPSPPDLGRAPGTVEIDGLYSMYITESIRNVCSGPDPFFTFDSSKPTGPDQPTMRNLVDCMTSGALRGRSIRLIGHADPRGTDVHNDELGLKRAEKVKTSGAASSSNASRSRRWAPKAQRRPPRSGARIVASRSSSFLDQ